MLMAYLDHAASTPMRPEAVEAMTPFLARHAANPSGGHRESQMAKNALEEARERVAALLGADPGRSCSPAAGARATTSP